MSNQQEQTITQTTAEIANHFQAWPTGVDEAEVNRGQQAVREAAEDASQNVDIMRMEFGRNIDNIALGSRIRGVGGTVVRAADNVISLDDVKAANNKREQVRKALNMPPNPR
ncbi:MAG: hypothetical protein M3Q14_01455 [bacterium]|nr:hypothetical protein [bacterium]